MTEYAMLVHAFPISSLFFTLLHFVSLCEWIQTALCRFGRLGRGNYKASPPRRCSPTIGWRGEPCEDHVKTILKIYETEINRVPEYRDSEEMMEMCDVPWGHRMSPGPPLPCQGAYSGLLDLGQVRGFKLTEVFHTLKVRQHVTATWNMEPCR